ncbi:MAG: precorrin-2 C(20)-methyltransferase [Eubacteriales bacterium]|nr:precorrin-2 C(20)-methyltransferase [Eubacteriales bacterium]
MKGILYGVGVGPGDPELMTVKAVRILRDCDAVAAPRSGGGEGTALSIAARYIEGKPVLCCDMPMTRDRAARDESHDKAADEICELLDAGKTVAFLTLGDPSIYSTYWYVHQRVAARGYDARMIPGVPSFCAAAAALGRALCEDDEMLHLIPASHGATDEGLALPGGKVLMKAGKGILEAREKLRARGELETAALVERCGMEGERIVRDLDALGEPTGYFSLILVKGETT